MAPSYASADAAYRQASDQLRATCTVLEFHLPPINTDEAGQSVILIPSARPRIRADSVLSCAQCAEELRDAEPGTREAHQCTHHQQLDESQGDRITDDGVVRRKQPSAFIIKQDLTDVKERFDVFTKTLSVLSGVAESEEAEGLGRHLLVWAEYIADLRARAGEVIMILEAPQVVQVPASTVKTPQDNTMVSSRTFTQAQLDDVNLAGASTVTVSSNGTQMRPSPLPVSGTPVVPAPATVSQSLEAGIILSFVSTNLVTSSSAVNGLGGSSLDEMKEYCVRID